MKRYFLIIILGFLSFNLPGQTISLSGKWSYKLDPSDLGQKELWYNQKFSDTLTLPGSLNSNGIGNVVSVKTKWTGSMWNKDWYESDFYKKYRDPDNTKIVFWLSPNHHYTGKVWYQKTIIIPRDWKNKDVVLNLERCHWKTTLWEDGIENSTCNSLSTPHRYLLRNLKPGKHTLTLCVDNRVVDADPGSDASSITDNTQTNWNGVIGDISIMMKPKIYIKSVKIDPLFSKKKIKVSLICESPSNKKINGNIELQAHYLGDKIIDLPEEKIRIKSSNDTLIAVYDMSDSFLLWDEFNPNLYELSVNLKTQFGTSSIKETFGLRKLGTKGTQITVNGRPVFLRGTLECCIFPKTGFPPTDEKSWEDIFMTCKKYGLNHMRFHSWCPPDAAFQAADKMGIYLYVESGFWYHNVGSYKPTDDFIYYESNRIISEYGNHPSFCLFSYGNEPHGKKYTSFLTSFVEYWKNKDDRFLYTTCAGWGNVPENDWQSSAKPRIQRWNEGLKSIINKQRPNSEYDWTNRIEHNKPTISHEIGQWCVYPDLKERSQYSGVLKAKNFDIFEDRLRDNGLLNLADSFLLASGKLQVLCYKADIEAALRTKHFGGFQLLDLHDFPGQGTALVGVLNPFWKSKGYVTAEEYSEFCNQIVPLAKLPKFIYKSGDVLSADVELAQYSTSSIDALVQWKILNKKGESLYSGSFPKMKIATGDLTKIGEIHQKINVSKPSQLQLVVNVGKYVNRWNLWVYPTENDSKIITKAGDIVGNVLIADKLDKQVLDELSNGGKVLLTPKFGTLKNEGKDSVVVGFSSIFWNTLWTNGQAPHTLGILCNPKHPALELFPTSYHSDYQWWDAMAHCNAIPLHKLGDIKPIVRIIDDWFTARSFGLITEMKVGNGSLVLTGADLLNNIDNRPAARQLVISLLNYMNSSKFSVKQSVSEKELIAIFK